MQLSAHIQSLNLQQNVSLSIEWRLVCTCCMKGSHATSHKPLFTSWATPFTATPCSNIQLSNFIIDHYALLDQLYWIEWVPALHEWSKTAHNTFTPFKTEMKRRNSRTMWHTWSKYRRMVHFSIHKKTSTHSVALKGMSGQQRRLIQITTVSRLLRSLLPKCW